ETRVGSITAGSGAVYAVRREAYLQLDPRTSHDLSFPFNLVKRGWRAVYEPRAVAVERPLASIEGEFRRKRRMMSHAWPAVLAGASLAAGLWDWLRHGTPATWERAEGRPT